MIRSLTPDMVRWAIQNNHLSYTGRARQLQVDRHTLVRAINEFNQRGLAAFEPSCLIAELRDIATGRTLSAAYAAYCLSGMKPRSKDAFRVILHRSNIPYLKVGTN